MKQKRKPQVLLKLDFIEQIKNIYASEFQPRDLVSDYSSKMNYKTLQDGAIEVWLELVITSRPGGLLSFPER